MECQDKSYKDLLFARTHRTGSTEWEKYLEKKVQVSVKRSHPQWSGYQRVPVDTKWKAVKVSIYTQLSGMQFATCNY